ncbi:MAG: GNAT family N-acetyltransferase [Bifidobacteriaceae bacterium]|jgi:putative glutathione S-transferase|nr:GNAT family N-acetyltransferase [Bifidobacteriaceae bacterium]
MSQSVAIPAAGALPEWARVRALPGGRTIREARPDEYAAAEDLLVAAFTTGCWVSEGYEQGLRRLAERAATWHIWVAVGRPAAPRERLAAAANDDAANAIDQPERLLGIVLTPRVEFWTRDHFTFSVLAVHPDGRGLSLGAALTDHAIDLARAHGFGVIQINSSPQMSGAHKLYYAKGFVRRPERETAFVSEYDERLLTFTYHIPDPLPPDQVIEIERRAAPAANTPPFWREPDRSTWPAPPVGITDQAGAFIPDTPPAEPLARAQRVIDRLAASNELAPPTADEAQLIDQITADLATGALTALWSALPEAAQAAVRVFFARLDTLDRRLARTGPFLSGGQRPGRADSYLFSVLLAYDLTWRPGFTAVGAVADWPHLWRQARLVLAAARLTPAERQAAGLDPLPDAAPPPVPSGRVVYAEPFGPLPPVVGLGDVRPLWSAEPASLRERRSARDPAVPVLPYPADWPGPSPSTAASKLDAAAAEVTRRQGASAEPKPAILEGRDRTAQQLIQVIAADLLGSLRFLIDASDQADRLATWRLIWARADWLNARLKGRRFLAGEHPSAADAALAAVFQAYRPDLRDFPRLERWLTEPATRS